MDGYGPRTENDPRLITRDGHRITDGLAVWDYDMRRGTVDFYGQPGCRGSMLMDPDGQYWDGWFNVKYADGPGWSRMDGSRVFTRHPVTREPA